MTRRRERRIRIRVNHLRRAYRVRAGGRTFLVRGGTVLAPVLLKLRSLFGAASVDARALLKRKLATEPPPG
jgi:hypothetical protein